MEYANHVISSQSLLIILRDGGLFKTYTFSSEDVNYGRLKALLDEKRFKEIPILVVPELRVKDQIGGKATIRKGKISEDGEEYPVELVEEMRKRLNSGLSVEPLKNFWKRLQGKAPNIVKDLFGFLNGSGVSFLPDGRFIMYKGVRALTNGYYPSHYTYEYHYFIGKEASVDPRFLAGPTIECGYGLHAAGWNFVGQHYSSGARLALLCAPEDVAGVRPWGRSTIMRFQRVLPLAEVTEPYSKEIPGTGVAATITRKKKEKFIISKSMILKPGADRVSIPPEFMAMALFHKGSEVFLTLTSKELHIHTEEVSIKGSVGSKKIAMLPSGGFRFGLNNLRKVGWATSEQIVAKVKSEGHIIVTSR